MSEKCDYLIPHYVRYVRSKTELATGEHYEPLELAAHLFAVAQQIVDDGHDLQKLPMYDGEIGSLIELGELLAQVPDKVSARDFYRLLTVALPYLERQCCATEDQTHGNEVRIGDISVGDQHRLGGRVVYWVRPAARFRELRRKGFDDALEAGKNLPRSLLDHPAKHLERLFCHWQGGHRPPVVRWVTLDYDHVVREVGRRTGEPFRVALCPLVGKAQPRFTLTGDRRKFRTCDRTPMVATEGQDVRSQLEVLLALAARHQVHVLVLPELMVDPATRNWLVEKLRTHGHRVPWGVVAGSFHFDKDDSSRPYNESRFLDRRGRKLLDHHKRGRFALSKKQLEACLKRGLFRDAEALRADLHSVAKEIDEHIEPGSVIELLDTSLGQMAVLICADAIDAQDRPHMHDAVRHIKPDFVFLPSMSFETRRFEDFAASMEELGVSTFFVNAHCICPRGQTLAAVSLALYCGPDDPPTRVRWRQGRGLEQLIRLGGDRQVWRRVAPGSTFEWLKGARGKHLGLVVDLGAYWRKT